MIAETVTTTVPTAAHSGPRQPTNKGATTASQRGKPTRPDIGRQQLAERISNISEGVRRAPMQTPSLTVQVSVTAAPSWRRKKLEARAEGHQVDPERAAFYRALWGEAEGFVQIVAGLPAGDILARGWPLAPDETPRDPAALGDKMIVLVWGRATGDTFKAAGRPHTGEVFAWPAEAQALDRYVAELAEAYDNVFCRKYVAQTPQSAKRGEAPAVAQVVQVEDAPAELPPDLPPYSFTLQTSDGSQQGFYQLPRALPWAQVEQLAGGLVERLRPLGADSGGPNPAQYTRIPTTRNTKARAGRFRVRFSPGAGPVELDQLAAGTLPGGIGALQGANETQRGRSTHQEPDPALWAEVEGYRGHLAAGGLLRRPDGTLRRPKPDHPSAAVLRGARGPAECYARWATVAARLGRDGSKTGWRFYLAETLHVYGYPQVEARAILEALAPEGGTDPRADIDRVLTKVWARPARSAESPTRGYTPAPAPAPWLATRPRRGRPAGARAGQVERLGELLTARQGQRVTRPQLGELLGVGPRAVAAYLAQLRASPAWDVELRALGRGGLLVEKCDRKSPAESVIAPPESVIVAGDEAPPEGIAAPEVMSGPVHGDHTPPDPPACPAPPAPYSATSRNVTPAPGAPTLDLEALARDLVETYGPSWSRVRRAAQRQHGVGGRGERDRLEALRQAYQRAALERRAADRRAARASRWRRADEALRRKAEAMAPGQRRKKLDRLADAMAQDLALAGQLRRQPFRRDPVTGELTAERISDKAPWQLEARAKVWARQHAIIACIHEGRLFTALEAEADEEAMRRLADAAFAEARRRAATAGPGPSRPRVTLHGSRPAAAADRRGVPSPGPAPASAALGLVARLEARKVAACAD